MKSKPPQVKALHQVVYGKGKTAAPGDLIEVSRENFSSPEEVERLITLGAIGLVEEREPEE